MAGQSSTPFMKATSNDNHPPKNYQRRGVTFDAMEMLERNSDCIERLTLLVSDMKMTMDRKQLPYKPKVYQGRSQIKIQVNEILYLEIDPTAEVEIKEVIKGIITIETITGQIVETDQEADGTTIGQVKEVITIRIIIDEVIRDQITDKMPSGLLGTEVRGEIEMMTILEVEVDLSQGEGRSLAPDLIPG